MSWSTTPNKKCTGTCKNWDRLIFAGDIIDIGYEAIKCFEILQENNAELLWGNHDVAIAINRPIWPQNAFDHEAKEKIKNNISSFKIAANVNNILITHAGLSEKFMIDQEINTNYRIPQIVRHLNNMDLDTLWYDDSPLWYRPTNKNLPYSISQIVGHTPPEWIKRCGFGSNNFISVDPYCTKNFGPDRYRYIEINNYNIILHDSNNLK